MKQHPGMPSVRLSVSSKARVFKPISHKQ